MARNVYVGHAAKGVIARAWWPPALFIVLWWVVALVAFPHVGAPMPLHFGVGGVADRYAQPSLGLWLGLPAIATGLALLLVAIGALATRYPAMIHLGFKSGADVAQSRQGELRRRVEELLSSTLLCVLCALASIHAGVFYASGAPGAALPGWSQLISALSLVAIMIFAIRFAIRAGALLNP